MVSSLRAKLLIASAVLLAFTAVVGVLGLRSSAQADGSVRYPPVQGSLLEP